jgi:bacterioferritin-associated ferredoxin
MIVCICHRLSDRDIASEVREGCASFDELRVVKSCGACTASARKPFAACHAAGEARTVRVPFQTAQAGA